MLSPYGNSNNIAGDGRVNTEVVFCLSYQALIRHKIFKANKGPESPWTQLDA